VLPSIVMVTSGHFMYAPREGTGTSAFVSDPFEKDQCHGTPRQLPLQATLQSVLLEVRCV
jgi:hypothetical protein